MDKKPLNIGRGIGIGNSGPLAGYTCPEHRRSLPTSFGELPGAFLLAIAGQGSGFRYLPNGVGHYGTRAAYVTRASGQLFGNNDVQASRQTAGVHSLYLGQSRQTTQQRGPGMGRVGASSTGLDENSFRKDATAEFEVVRKSFGACNSTSDSSEGPSS